MHSDVFQPHDNLNNPIHDLKKGTNNKCVEKIIPTSFGLAKYIKLTFLMHQLKKT